MKKFRTIDSRNIEVERDIKNLKLIKIENTDYYKGKNHDAFEFVDGENNRYVYDASLNADMTEYDTKIAKELCYREKEYCKISAYFVPVRDGYFYMYNPRLLDSEEG